MTWSIVLAGGKGERLASFTERWLGRYVPKQYCAFVGRRSMLEHTLDRAHRVSTWAMTLTVVAREHRELAARQVRGRLIEQPVNRDTAAFTGATGGGPTGSPRAWDVSDCVRHGSASLPSSELSP